MTELVTSVQNPRLKLLRKLGVRRGRTREAAFAVEGEDLVLAGVNAGWQPRFVVFNADAPADPDVRDQLSGVPSIAVHADVLRQVAELAHPPRVVGVFDLPAGNRMPDAAHLPPAAPAVYLDGVRDPGNVGTVLRTAGAFAVPTVALGPTSTDPFGAKATRASMGAVFTVATPPVAGITQFLERSAALTGARPADVPVVALHAEGGAPIWDVELGGAPVLCIGAERAGLSEETLQRADVVASIPQRPEADSINAATAAAIVLYEWRRQQSTG